MYVCMYVYTCVCTYVHMYVLNPAITVNANNRGLGRVPTVDNSVHCSVCQRTFNQPGDSQVFGREIFTN